MRAPIKPEHRYINDFLACKCAPDMIDTKPLSKRERDNRILRRLRGSANQKIEECERADFRISDESTVVVAAVHSHARLDAVIKTVGKVARLAIVAIPCCVTLTLPIPTMDVYQDHGIWSTSKTVLLWDLKNGLPSTSRITPRA